MDKYLYIFIHIPKTGGSSFRKHIEKNIGESERLLFEYKDLRYGKKVKSRKKETRKRASEKIASLTKGQRKKIKVIYGHSVPYGIHEYFERPSRYIVFIREPNKRTLSLYNFILFNYKRDTKKGVKRVDYKYQLLVDGKIPDFAEWVDRKYGVRGKGVDTTFQLLKDLGYVASIKSIGKQMDKFWFVGLTKNLNKDLLFLYETMGFNKFFVRQNITKKEIGSIRKKELRSKLAEKNNKDYKIYEGSLRSNQKFKEKAKDYESKVKKAKVKRGILLPFTQVLFDPKGSLIDLSGLLRRKSRFYEKTFDYVRGYK